MQSACILFVYFNYQVSQHSTLCLQDGGDLLVVLPLRPFRGSLVPCTSVTQLGNGSATCGAAATNNGVDASFNLTVAQQTNCTVQVRCDIAAAGLGQGITPTNICACFHHITFLKERVIFSYDSIFSRGK